MTQLIKTTKKFENVSSLNDAYDLEIRRIAKVSEKIKEKINKKSKTTFFENGSRVRCQENLTLKVWEKK